MSSQSNQPRDSLRHLSDYTLDEQNLDIGLRTAGHLNERHLWKPREMRTHQPWDSSKPREPELRFKPLWRDSFVIEEERQIARESARKTQLIALDDRQMLRSVTSSPMWKHHQFPPPVSQEGISLPGIDSKAPYNTAHMDEKYGMSDKELAMKVLASPFFGLTKQDKFKNMAKYGREVLGKDDLLISNVLHSNESAAYLEQKLVQELENLELENGSIDQTTNASLVRLNVFSNIFEELVCESSMFGETLRKLKSEYDDYLFYLLRNPDADDAETLIERQMKLTEGYRMRSQARMKQLDDDIDRLEHAVLDICESNAEMQRHLVAENDFYREKWAAQAELDEYFESKKQDKDFNKPLKKLTLSDRVEAAKKLVLEKLDELRAMNERLREGFVPIAVIVNLNRTIKDIDLEILKLEEQNKYLRSQELEIEKELRRLFMINDKTEFAEENAEYLLKFIKNFEVLSLNMKNEAVSNPTVDQTKEQPTDVARYDDYFS